jgi:hypothetical protein
LTDEQPPQIPARPLVGYRDIGEHEERHSREAHIRAWVILGVIAAVYLVWTLVVYFFEPGLR